MLYQVMLMVNLQCGNGGLQEYTQGSRHMRVCVLAVRGYHMKHLKWSAVAGMEVSNCGTNTHIVCLFYIFILLLSL